jgi:hypothetical protein
VAILLFCSSKLDLADSHLPPMWDMARPGETLPATLLLYEGTAARAMHCPGVRECMALVL